jgi:hypothetical protein
MPAYINQKRQQLCKSYGQKEDCSSSFYHPTVHIWNIIERLWKEIKGRWLQPKDYDDEQQLFYSTRLILDAIGKSLFLNYSLQN